MTSCSKAWWGLGLWWVAMMAGAQGRFIDPQDGYFDLSDHLLQQKGFMPVPIVITEPALDYGGGLGALWFSESLDEAKHKSGDGPMVPPSIGGLFAFKSGNGSWGAGGGYFMPLDEDRYRYLGGAGKVSLNLDYYLPRSATAAAYQLEGAGLVQQLLARVGSSNWWLGPRYIYFSSESSFAHQSQVTVPTRDLDMQIGQLSLIVDYDSRDNMFTPGKGGFMEAELATVRDWLGASMEYNTLALRGFYYQPLTTGWILGVRGDSRQVGEQAPFFAQPYIALRGVPAMRYQDQQTLVGEAELRWDMTPRWALLGFGGIGKAYGQRSDWSEAESVAAGGVGFRYLIARKLGLYSGIDVARGSETTAIYLQVGSAWR